jgi:hypothetical protein
LHTLKKKNKKSLIKPNLSQSRNDQQGDVVSRAPRAPVARHSYPPSHPHPDEISRSPSPPQRRDRAISDTSSLSAYYKRNKDDYRIGEESSALTCRSSRRVPAARVAAPDRAAARYLAPPSWRMRRRVEFDQVAGVLQRAAGCSGLRRRWCSES